MSYIGPNLRQPGQPHKPPVSANLENTKAVTSAEKGQNQALVAQPVGSLATIPLDALFAYENLLSTQQMLQLLRNLLQIPREIVQLLAMFTNLEPQLGDELLKTLWQEAPQLSVEDLQRFMQDHIDKAQEKLLQLIQNDAMRMTGSGQQLGDLMSALSELAAKTEKSPTEALHGTINLYLPSQTRPDQAFSLWFESPSNQKEDTQDALEDGKQAGSESPQQLVLFIQTRSLGQFKIALITEQIAQLQTIIEHNSRVTPLMNDLLARVKAALGAGYTTRLNFVTIPRNGPVLSTDAHASLKATDDSKHPEQSVGIHPIGGISVIAIHAAYWLIRIILETDNRNELHSAQTGVLSP